MMSAQEFDAWRATLPMTVIKPSLMDLRAATDAARQRHQPSLSFKPPVKPVEPVEPLVAEVHYGPANLSQTMDSVRKCMSRTSAMIETAQAQDISCVVLSSLYESRALLAREMMSLWKIVADRDTKSAREMENFIVDARVKKARLV